VKIINLETTVVGAGWKNWTFVRVHTDAGVDGVGEGTLNGFARTVDTAVSELGPLVIGRDPRRVAELGRRLLDRVSNDGGQIHRTAAAAIEIACWDILGKSLGVPVYALFGGPVRTSMPAYANGWYRTERTASDFVRSIDAVLATGLRAAKLDPFGTANGFMSHTELRTAVDIISALRARVGPDFDLLVDAHARFTQTEAIRVARALEPYGVYWLEEPCARDQQQQPSAVAQTVGIPVATGETFHTPGQFHDLAVNGSVDIWQPEPMSLGGIGPTLTVASMAAGSGAWIAPHQSGGPIATAVCLQLAGCVPNFLIQEHFDPFNEPWTRELVTWAPTIDSATGQLGLPTGPGLGVDFDDDIAQAHPYDPNAYLDIHQPGWEKRLGQRRCQDVRAAAER
jgi:galactonate dehydratase